MDSFTEDGGKREQERQKDAGRAKKDLDPDSELRLIRQRIIETTSIDDMRENYLSGIAETKKRFAEEQDVAGCLRGISALRDAVTEVILPSVEGAMARDGFGPLPIDYCWVAVGSQGRGEETFVTDQDFLLVYEVVNPFGPNEHPDETIRFSIDEFCRRTVDMFHAIGISRCKGGIVPSNQKWRGSTELWKGRIDRRCGDFERFLVDFFVLTDARPVTGNTTLLDEVTNHLLLRLQQNSRVLAEMAHLAVSIPTTAFLGRLRTDTKGKHKGKVNLKLTGRTPLVLCLQCLALFTGIKEVGSSGRIGKLIETGMIKEEMGSMIEEGLRLFLKHRLMNEIEEKQRDELNYVDPDEMSKQELSAIRSAVSAVRSLQKHTHRIILPRQLPTS